MYLRSRIRNCTLTDAMRALCDPLMPDQYWKPVYPPPRLLMFGKYKGNGRQVDDMGPRVSLMRPVNSASSMFGNSALEVI